MGNLISINGNGVQWVYLMKRKILLGLLGLFSVFLVLSMGFVVVMLRGSMLRDSMSKAQGLSETMMSSIRGLMVVRNPGMIQETFEHMGKNKELVMKAFVLDKGGRIVYSSDRSEIGNILDKDRDESCRFCHQKTGHLAGKATLPMKHEGVKILRSVQIIYNEPACYGCHPKNDRINGTLIIDSSLERTYSIISSIEFIMAGSGILCLIILFPFLSKRIDKYIVEIIRQRTETAMFYAIVDRLSKSIDIEELKVIVTGIVEEAFDANEVFVILPQEYEEFKVFGKAKGEGIVTRKRIEDGDPLLSTIGLWLNDGMVEEELSYDRKRLYMPIKKAGEKLALLIAVKTEKTFGIHILDLAKPVSNHIAIAFENARLYSIAITDELTRLYTQRHFRYCIDREFTNYEKYGQKFSLLMLDLDDFKLINDTHGHLAGDAVLKEVAEIIKCSLRDNDLAFRYGGEEFSAILPSTDLPGSRLVADRVRENIESFVFDKGKLNIKMTISIGISVCPRNATSVRDMILSADSALYNAKRTGKNRVLAGDDA